MVPETDGSGGEPWRELGANLTQVAVPTITKVVEFMAWEAKVVEAVPEECDVVGDL